MNSTSRTKDTFKINASDRKAITVQGQRLTGYLQVMIEVNLRVDGIRRMEPNVLLLDNGHDLDDTIKMSDLTWAIANTVDGKAQLDVCVCTKNDGQWEPTDYLYPLFEEGRLVKFLQGDEVR